MNLTLWIHWNDKILLDQSSPLEIFWTIKVWFKQISGEGTVSSIFQIPSTLPCSDSCPWVPLEDIQHLHTLNFEPSYRRWYLPATRSYTQVPNHQQSESVYLPREPWSLEVHTTSDFLHLQLSKYACMEVNLIEMHYFQSSQQSWKDHTWWFQFLTLSFQLLFIDI